MMVAMATAEEMVERTMTATTRPRRWWWWKIFFIKYATGDTLSILHHRDPITKSLNEYGGGGRPYPTVLGRIEMGSRSDYRLANGGGIVSTTMATATVEWRCDSPVCCHPWLAIGRGVTSTMHGMRVRGVVTMKTGWYPGLCPYFLSVKAGILDSVLISCQSRLSCDVFACGCLEDHCCFSSRLTDNELWSESVIVFQDTFGWFFNLETCSAPVGSVSQQPFTSMDQELGFSGFN
ncbi:hypothetical protein AKJ16_DCAP05503 [Drosera capensis]